MWCRLDIWTPSCVQVSAVRAVEIKLRNFALVPHVNYYILFCNAREPLVGKHTLLPPPCTTVSAVFLGFKASSWLLQTFLPSLWPNCSSAVIRPVHLVCLEYPQGLNVLIYGAGASFLVCTLSSFKCRISFVVDSGSFEPQWSLYSNKSVSLECDTFGQMVETWTQICVPAG